MTMFPDIVRVTVGVVHADKQDESNATVADESGTPVFSGSLRRVHEWLRDNGYEWVTATDGLWRQAGKVQKTSRDEWR